MNGRFAGLACGAITMMSAGLAAAEPAANDWAHGPGYALGGWSLYPHLELRLRGDYRRNPIDTGGQIYDSSAVQADGPAGLSPNPIDTLPAVRDQWFIGERARLGLAVERGPAAAIVTLQDARVAGGEPIGEFAPYEAYLDIHTERQRDFYARLGRQSMQWGNGRLLGANTSSPRGRSLDALRAGLRYEDLDAELLAVMLEPPGALAPETEPSERRPEGAASQLYGAHAVYHFAPLLAAEGTALLRFVRPPHSSRVTPGDTYTFSGRLFGDSRGLRYDAEFAGQVGRVASFGENRSVGAFAAAGHVEWETSLPWHLTFGVDGGYASGAGNAVDTTQTQKRFDPILPNEHDRFGAIMPYAWSNLIAIGGTLGARPLDEFKTQLGYRYVGLAEETGRWTSGTLVPIGADFANTSSVLGHHVFIGIDYHPWEMLGLGASYGALILGEGGENILRAAQRNTSTPQFAHLHATVSAP